ncbi:hypothetical protein AGMMS50268_29710 [Spirochaetia bacterium]|nr:hypothetical protein AGMMS50268_29710 [Spirochaetia bacterium]
MFITGKKEVAIYEYTHASVSTTGAHLKKNGNNDYLNFSSLRLSIAMARTILSKNPADLDLFFQACSSFFGMQTIIESSDPKLKLTNDYSIKFRDFSLTGRIGELAQAINYIFAQDYLKYPIVVDFWGYISSQLPSTITYKGQSPDFVLKKFGVNSISLLESKGSCPWKSTDKLKSKLNEALEQCDAGSTFISDNKIPVTIDKKYASCVWFSNTNEWDTRIGFCDPEGVANKYNTDSHSLFRYHYASWFSMIGLFKFSKQLLNNEIRKPLRPNKYYTNRDERFLVFDPKFIESYQEIIEIPYFEWRKAKFGISEKIWDILIDGQEEIENLKFEPVSKEKVEIFADGTIVLYGDYHQEGDSLYL